MSEIKLNIIILAAGFGKRLKSKKSKVVIDLVNKPVIHHLIDNIKDVIDPENTYVIVGHKAEDVEKTISTKLRKANFVLQKEQLGTGHAVRQAQPYIKNFTNPTLILAGDVPLVTDGIIQDFYNYHTQTKSDLSVLTTNLSDPTGYGRIVRDEDSNSILKIVEERDANDKEKEINEINSGIYLINTSILFDLLQKITPDNNQKEYYLTDIIKLAQEQRLNIQPFLFHEYELLEGVNSRSDLVRIGKQIYKTAIEKHLENGVTIMDPTNTFIEPEVVIEKDVTIEPFVHIKGSTIIREDSYIKSFSYLQDYESKQGEIISRLPE